MAKTVSGKRKQQRRQAILRLLILSAILVCCNVLAMRFHYKLDLTEDRRFTLSPATRQLLQGMKDVATVTVYLEGKDFPAGLQRLHDATRERLQSFRDISGNHVVFRFLDPFEDKDEKEKMEMYRQLADKGILPSGINVSKEERYTQQMIFPYALVTYNGRELPVKLLENNSGSINPGVINYSETLLEYKLANAIHMLSLPDKRRIAYIVGHGEPLGPETYDALTTLSKYYHVDTMDLTERYYIPMTEELIIISRPTQAFDDKEKFKIDQYVMKGGHVLWSLDMLHTPMDSLMYTQQFLAMDYGLNLDDILFKYGVRVNASLIEDMQCNTLPVTATDGQSGVRLLNWIYLPVFTPSSSHPIVHNMDAVMGIFANSIDTIASVGIRKTVLLESSKYSRVAAAPVRVSLATLHYQPRPEMFNRPYQPVAVLLEGRFGSVFRNRMHPAFLKVLDSLRQPFIAQAERPGSMIVVADGDMFLNDVDARTGPLEMGYWRYANPPARFANKSFFLNCVEYLTDTASLLEARSKDTRLRLLDAGRAKNEQSKWTIINIGVPVLLVLVFASIYLFFRKRRYEGHD